MLYYYKNINVNHAQNLEGSLLKTFKIHNLIPRSKLTGHKITALLLALIMTLGLAGCSITDVLRPENPTSVTDSDNNNGSGQAFSETPLAAFDDFTNELFRKELSDNTLNLHCFVKDPSKFGIEKYPATLGKIDLDNLDDTSEITDLLNRLSTFKYTDLSKDQQLTYDILKNQLQTNLEYSDLYLYGSSLTPYSGDTVTLPILLSEYEFYSKSDVEDYIGLLNDMKRYFTQLVEFEKKRSEAGLFMSDEIASELISQCETFIKENEQDSSFLISTFAARLDELKDLSQSEKDNYTAANKAAITDSVLPAYQIVIDGIKSLMGTGKNEGGLSGYTYGRKYYEYLLKSDLGWSKSMDDLDAFLDQYIRSSHFMIQAILLENPDIVNKLDDFSFTITEPDQMLTDLKKKLEKDFPTPPNVNYVIKDIDKSLEENSNPAMYLIPQIDNYTENIILINKAQCDFATLYPTIAHEGYPGHMYQNTYFSSLNPSPLRIIMQSGGYSEGWAEYVEFYAYDYDDNASDNKMFRLLKENQMVMLALYTKMDMGVNYYGWSKDRLLIFLKDWGISEGADIDFLYKYLTAEPGTYPKYSIGCFAFTDWKNQASGLIGDKFDLKEFHKFIMDLGPVPFDIIDKKLPEWIENQKNKAG